MTWENKKLDREYLQHVQQTDYGAAITDEMINEIVQNQKLRELTEEAFQFYDETFKKHKDIDDFKIAQVLQRILKRSKE